MTLIERYRPVTTQRFALLFEFLARRHLTADLSRRSGSCFRRNPGPADISPPALL
jgi:hypothetical protein